MNLRNHGVAIFFLVGGLLALSRCQFSPEVESGSLACDRGRCPVGFICSAAGLCCAGGDRPCADRSAAPGGEGGRPSAPVDAAASAIDAGPPLSERWTRLTAGSARLIGWRNACTQGGAAGGADRWCGFYRGSELWMLNVSRSAAMGGVRCDGSDSNCLRLTGAAYRTDAAVERGPQSAFQGDLLLYYADAQAGPAGLFRGVVYVWRPGWNVGRALTRNRGEACLLSKLDGGTVVCLENSDGTLVDIVGGRLPADGMPLPLIERALRDRTNIRVAYAGDYIVYGWAATATEAPAIHAVPAGQVANRAARIRIATNAKLTAVGGNGTKVFYTKVTDLEDPSAPSTLMRVDLPTGSNPVEVAQNIAWGRSLETPVKDVGLVAFADLGDGGSALVSLFADPAMPTRSFALGRVVIDSITPAPQGRYLQLQAVPMSEVAEARVFDPTGGVACTLGPTRTFVAGVDRFSSDESLAFWEKDLGAESPAEGWLASSADCMPRRKLGVRVSGPLFLGAHGVAYQDDWSAATGATLRLLGPTTEIATATPEVIAEGTDRPFSAVGGEASWVVFTTSAPGREGVYAAKVPF